MSKDKFFKGYNPDFLSRYGSRDWQKDMELVKEYGNSDMPYNLTEFAKMLPYWLEQYAHEANEVCYWKGEAKTEKERADKAEAYPTIDAYEATCTALHKHRERADKAEEREQKLREAIEEIAAYPPFKETNNGDRFYEQIREAAKDILISLYPLDKEEEV